MKTLGTHLMIDGYVKSDQVFVEESLLSIIDDLVTTLGMKYLCKPIIQTVPYDQSEIDTYNDEGGISIIAPITTSHISAHCWPLRKLLMMDIFSCKPFDTAKAEKMVIARFGLGDYKSYTVTRDNPVKERRFDNYYCIFPWQRIPSI